jgi:cytochrome c biogenesis protein CcmG, thiol:disulfide interchange protein DsbE
MNWRSALIAAVLTAPMVAILALGFGRNPQAVPSVLEGKAAPSFALSSLDGKPLTSDELRGKPVVLNFWASWCQPCMVEHEALQNAARALGDKVHFLGVVFQDSPANAKEYLAQRGNVFPQLLDPTSKLAIDFGVAGVPESFFLDKNGVVRRKHVGVLTEELIATQVMPLLGEGP